MRERKNLKAFRFTDAQVEILEQLAEHLKMNQTEVISLALYRLCLETFRKARKELKKT